MRTAIEASRSRLERISVASDSAETVETRSVKMFRGSTGHAGARKGLFDCQASEDSYKMWELQQLGQRAGDAAQLATPGQSYRHPKHRRNRISIASRDGSVSPQCPELPIDVDTSSGAEDKKIQSPIACIAVPSDSLGMHPSSHVVRIEEQNKENLEKNSREDVSALPLKERLQAKRRKSIPPNQVDVTADHDVGLDSRADGKQLIDLDARPDSRNKARAKQQAKEKSFQKKACDDEVQALRKKLEEANRAREEAAEKQRQLERETAEKQRQLEREAAEKQRLLEREKEEKERALKAKKRERGCREAKKRKSCGRGEEAEEAVGAGAGGARKSRRRKKAS
jgi:hypothetical protein